MAVHMISFVGVIFALMVVGGIVLVAFLVSRTQSPTLATHPPMGETPLQILDRRFASGEIDAEEYKRAKDLLSGGGRP
jgi:uncharacterized membrane protein